MKQITYNILKREYTNMLSLKSVVQVNVKKTN